MDSTNNNSEEIRSFIKLIQQLNEQEQAGVLQIIQGVRLICNGKNKKQRIIRRSYLKN